MAQFRGTDARGVFRGLSLVKRAVFKYVAKRGGPSATHQSLSDVTRIARGAIRVLRAQAPPAMGSRANKNTSDTHISNTTQYHQESPVTGECGSPALSEVLVGPGGLGVRSSVPAKDPSSTTSSRSPPPPPPPSLSSSSSHVYDGVLGGGCPEFTASTASTPLPPVSASVSSDTLEETSVPKFDPRRVPREAKRVPASPLARVAGFAGLGASLAFGTVGELVKQTLSGNLGKGAARDLVLTEANADRLVDTLCRMRGAALKLGQMISIQDPATIPPQILRVLDRVRQSANMMPASQLHEVMSQQLGRDWESQFASFNKEPVAAASIGQVHEATMHDGRRVAVKVQYPGVSRSIDSDMWNLKQLVSVTNILPKGLYVEHAIEVMREELRAECDYIEEGRNMMSYREYVRDWSGMQVPEYIPELSTKHVLTSTFLEGQPLDDVQFLDKKTRDRVSDQLFNLTLHELFIWGYMQTDPSFSNYLYDPKTETISLLDFGAAKRYSRRFVDDYLEMVHACVTQDRDKIIQASLALKMLTGDENKEMLNAHVEAGILVGAPFRSMDKPYNFKDQDMTVRVSQMGQVMLKHRLVPPPREAYTLHRRLSGAFLTAIRLDAQVQCGRPFMEVYNNYQFGLDDWPDYREWKK